ncbi:MAG: hypothetical protein JST51_11695 [Armatimonadetes bacterium]|nr:hypothetical protein [Armatimonadota bacterium]
MADIKVIEPVPETGGFIGKSFLHALPENQPKTTEAGEGNDQAEPNKEDS